jgi:hypothetical protein
VGFYADGKLKKIPAASGAVQVLARLTTDFRGGTWGPDDTIVFGNGSESISRVSAGGSISQVSTANALNENQLSSTLSNFRRGCDLGETVAGSGAGIFFHVEPKA